MERAMVRSETVMIDSTDDSFTMPMDFPGPTARP
jgi:hypothetical protein